MAAELVLSILDWTWWPYVEAGVVLASFAAVGVLWVCYGRDQGEE